VLGSPHVRDESHPPQPWRGRDLLRFSEEPVRRIGLARLRSRRQAEMRHTFVSVLSANGVPVESIALLAGHERTATTESVYRHEIRPALTQGAEVMDKIFG
jgi:integrase